METPRSLNPPVRSTAIDVFPEPVAPTSTAIGRESPGPLPPYIFHLIGECLKIAIIEQYILDFFKMPGSGH